MKLPVQFWTISYEFGGGVFIFICFSRPAFPWEVAGAVAGLKASEHLDHPRRKMDALVECQSNPTKIINDHFVEMTIFVGQIIVHENSSEQHSWTNI